MTTLIEQHLEPGHDPVITGTEWRVSHVIGHSNADGWTATQIAERLDVHRDAVLACMAYYLDNRQQINAAINRRNRAYQHAAKGAE
jgi:uncharacterized protein (DUF433 family)